MKPQRIEELIGVYRGGLLNDTLPFWFPRCVDSTFGGFMIARDRDGTLLDDDKGVWQQGRSAWLLGELYNNVEPRDEWLELVPAAASSSSTSTASIRPTAGCGFMSPATAGRSANGATPSARLSRRSPTANTPRRPAATSTPTRPAVRSSDSSTTTSTRGRAAEVHRRPADASRSAFR